MKKSPINVDVLNLLLDKASKLIPGHCQSITELVNSEAENFVKYPATLPFNPFRISGSKKQQNLSEELFPRRRTVIWVYKEMFLDYKSILLYRAVEQFDLAEANYNSVTNRFAIEVALWYALKKSNTNIDSPYFSDKDFLEIIDIDDIIRKALIDSYKFLGRFPKSREYEVIRKKFGGPSLSLIKRKLGSYSNAKTMIELELKKYI